MGVLHPSLAGYRRRKALKARLTDEDVKKAVKAREAARKQAEIESAWRQRERDTSGYYPRCRARRAAERAASVERQTARRCGTTSSELCPARLHRVYIAG